MSNDPVYLYILMRHDLASLNAGKGMAQAAHASNLCVKRANRVQAIAGLVKEWETEGQQEAIRKVNHTIKNAEHDGVPIPSEIAAEMLLDAEDRGFGVTITLGAKIDTIKLAVAIARESDLHAGMVLDPSYPLLDGETLHLIPLHTCAYVLCRKSQFKPITDMVIRKLRLDPNSSELQLHP